MASTTKPEGEPSQASQAWSIAAVLECIASYMSDNDVACSLRQLNKFTAGVLSGRRTVHLSQPCPPRAFEQRWGSPSAMHPLTCSQRQKLLHLTAASGVLPNLLLALSRTGCVPTAAALAAAAAAGQLPACKALRGYGCSWNPSVLEAAAVAGHADVVVWLLDAGCPGDSTALLVAAAGAGQGELCELLVRQRGATWTGAAAAAAARGGFVALLETALAALGRAMEKPRVCGGVLQAVAEGCDFETLLSVHSTWVDRLGSPTPALQQDQIQDQDRGQQADRVPGLGAAELLATMSAAIVSPTPDWRDKVEWLRARGYPAPRAAAARIAAARAAELPDAPARLAWLREQQLPLPRDQDLARAIARGRRLDLLDFMSAGNPGLLGKVARMAADLAFLQELHARGASIRADRSIEHVVRAGDVEAAAWLLENFGVKPPEGAEGGAAGAEGGAEGATAVEEGVAAELTVEVFAAGATSGRLEMLEWLRERGCPWDASVFAAAAGAGAAEQIEWLAARGCPVGVGGERHDRTRRHNTQRRTVAPSQDAPYVLAARNGDLATLKLLRRLGCAWDSDGSTFTAAVAWACELPVLEWLLESGCPVDWDTAMDAAELRQRPLGVVEWLQEQRQRRQQRNRRCVLQ